MKSTRPANATQDPIDPDKNVFDSHGAELTFSRSSQAEGNCPFCGKESHFYVDKATQKWHCKVCDESGNRTSFLQKLLAASLESTSDAQYQELSEDRGISAAVLKEHKLAVSCQSGQWLLPYFNAKGQIVGLYKYGSDGKLYQTATCKQSIFRAGTVSNQHSTVWVCEGPWDAMALYGRMGTLHTVRTKKRLLDTNAVIALPSASSCLEQLADLCEGKAVNVLMDNDDAGRKSKDAIIAKLAGKCDSIKAIEWPRQASPGFDIRDLSSQEGNKTVTTLKGMLQPVETPEPSEEDYGDCPFKFYNCMELVEADFRISYLIENVLCADHPCGIIGPMKSVKTGLSLDMAVALATGGRFLNHFNAQQANVIVMSGESGLPTIRETAIRIARHYGHDLYDLKETIQFCGDLPSFKNDKHCYWLERRLTEFGAKVLILDPAYRCLDPEGRESSLFAMGKQLAAINDLCHSVGVTLVLAHHTIKALPYNKIVQLHQASWAGIPEFLRQWIGSNRRKAYKPGSGHHELILNFGGSMGHSGVHNVNIEEGVTNGPEDQRFWEPTVMAHVDADVAAQATKLKKKLAAIEKRVVAFLEKNPEGDTQRCIANAIGASNQNCSIALASLEAKKRVGGTKSKKGRQTVTIYTLSTSA